MRKWNLDRFVKDFYDKKYNKVLDKLSQRYGRENSEDIIQEALLKFCQYYNEEKGDPEKYLTTVIHSQVKNHLRVSTKNFEFELVDIDIETIEDTSTPVDKITELEIIFNELSDIFKDSFSMNYKELSEKHGLSKSQIGKNLYNERKKIKERWED